MRRPLAGRSDAAGSPQRVSGAIKVAASNISDAQTPYTNFGRCTDIFAPGDQIYSAYFGDQTEFVYMTGTSMCASLVAPPALTMQLHRTSPVWPRSCCPTAT